MCADLKDIALVIDGEDPLADAVQAGVALRLAHHYGARICVFEQSPTLDFEHLSWGADDPSADGYACVEVSGLVEQQRGRRFGERPALSELLREARDEGDWHKQSAAKDLLEHLRCVDLVVAGSPPGLGKSTTLEVADIVMQAGRPVLIVPRKFAQRHYTNRKIGFHALVAWNASAPAARAIHDALPFLQKAEEITLLFVNQHRSKIAAHRLVSAMAAHLKRHGVNVRPEVSIATGHHVSRIISERLAELDVDLLVMGAFSRSRLSETWLGGTSEELFRDAAVPILTSH